MPFQRQFSRVAVHNTCVFGRITISDHPYLHMLHKQPEVYGKMIGMLTSLLNDEEWIPNNNEAIDIEEEDFWLLGKDVLSLCQPDELVSGKDD